MSVVVGGVGCVGTETGLLECPHANASNGEVVGCDPNQIAAVACQGELLKCSFPCSFCHMLLFTFRFIH